MKTQRQLTDWVCSVCSQEETAEGYMAKPKGWASIDFGPTGDDELHLCDRCWERLRAWPAFEGRAEAIMNRKVLKFAKRF